MNDVNILCHTRWECKYHVVWIPKCRRKVLFGQLRQNLGEVFHELARQNESKVLKGHLQPDHVHMMIAIPPKYAVSQVVGNIKGKKCDPYSPNLPWAKEKLWRHELLGTWLFCVNR
jgi:putative transposase